MQFFFIKFKNRTHERYPSLFKERIESDYPTSEQGFSNKWGWYASLFSLSQGKITEYEKVEKLNLDTCLTFLSFIKEKNQLERQQIKNARQRKFD